MTESQVTTRRREDARLVSGRGRYTADLSFDGMLWAVFARAPHAHAVVNSVDVSQALAAEGVVAVLTHAELEADGIIPDDPGPKLGKLASGPLKDGVVRPLLVKDKVRYLGEPVAIVIADTQECARAAADLVAVDYTELPAYAGTDDAMAEGSAPIWDEAPGNIAFRYQRGDMDAVEKALAESHHVTTVKSRITRVSANPMEPRNAIATFDETGRSTLYISAQSPHAFRTLAAKTLKVANSELRVVAGDVGGSFGMKAGLLREEMVLFWASRRIKRTVKWIAERGESFLSDEHGRDVAFETRLGLDKDGNFTAFSLKYWMNIGGYPTSRSIPPIRNIGGIAGVYRTPVIAADVNAVITNAQPTSSYRGAGRPEATFVVERSIDTAARELGIDPMELRRRNLIAPEAMPFKTGFIFTYDCGDFPEVMRKAAGLADYAGFARRRDEARKQGKLRGIGICNSIEVAAGPYGSPGSDWSKLQAHADGTVTILSGTMSVGQGWETAMPEILSRRLEIPTDRIKYVQGDTGIVPRGKGSGGSGGAALGASAMALAATELVANGKKLAAERFKVAPEQVDYRAGLFTVTGTNHTMSLGEAARLAGEKPSDDGAPAGLVGNGAFTPENATFPNGCHICEVEIDEETGEVRIVGYSSVEDVGTVMNHTLVNGQVHGGVAQGIGQALKEEIVYDRGSGQLLTGSFMDYGMPVAADIPPIVCADHEVPTKVNPLGVKGVGEAGTVGALTASFSAVCNALEQVGVKSFEMPASPSRVWAAIQAARSA
jgi:carbon-monoxide dehydrogenase large subunit